jgi:hypothetical protein
VQTPSVDDERLAEWCDHMLGARPVETLFVTGHLSVVVGVRLADEREVVIKMRPDAPRISGCVAVQGHLWALGFPCPRPLAGPRLIGSGETATAEEYVPGGVQLVRDSRAPEQFARLLWQLIDQCAELPMEFLSLGPPPPWVEWDHTLDGIWPRDDDGDDDFNADAEPRWLDDVAARARRILLHFQAPDVLGHVDWESQNIRWHEGRPLVVHDWDSAAARPEATIAGAAAAEFTVSGEPPSAAIIAETELFLDAYQRARGVAFTREELSAAWAAGLWTRAFNAKKTRVHRAAETEAFADEAWERLRRAGG